MQQHLERLEGVHPDLVKVVRRAFVLRGDLMVLEGLRTQAQEEEAVRTGHSKTLHSRHLDGHAVDIGVLLAGVLCWDWPLYTKLAVTMKQAAREERVPVEWGGDWTTLKDGPHFQLPWAQYPSQAPDTGASTLLVS